MFDLFSQRCMIRDSELRSRVKLFGNLLGDILRSQSGENVFRVIERLRKGFIALRKQAQGVSGTHRTADARSHPLCPVRTAIG